MDSSIKVLSDALTIAAKKAAVDIAKAPIDGRATWGHVSKETYEPLAFVLRSIPSIAQHEGEIWCFPYYTTKINFETFALHLAYLSIHSSPIDVAENLLKISENLEYTFIEVKLLRGIEIDHTFSIAEGLSLHPANTLVGGFIPLEAMEGFFNSFPLPYQDTINHILKSTAVLVCERTLKIKTFPIDTSIEEAMGNVEHEYDDRWPDVSIALHLVSDGVLEMWQGLIVYPDIGFPSLNYQGAFYRPSVTSKIKLIQNLDLGRFHDVYQLSSGLNPTLKLALDRLIEARVRQNYEDTIIDLGICAEILLTAGDTNNNEISFKIATRAAWLLGDKAPDRLRIYQLMKSLYSKRSKAVHQGQLKKPIDHESARNRENEIASFDSACRNLIIKLSNQSLSGEEAWTKLVLNLT